ncbi:hypothetical protein EX30DRAFT_336059 [Ascodesmis nigricans]|uniref:N-acetyltransferase domain-containing protein n=1 Tax=Ascodesmis nigricans TaxID=341454 RepID=A0A4S2MNY6_9PEZI|nr:hypothetical protein EX30DRAFT_336059 [Ascodesmis nigricans]
MTPKCPAPSPPPLGHFALTRIPSKSIPSNLGRTLLDRIQRTEKLNFPTSEAFDFPSELSKRTTVLQAAYDLKRNELYGYVVYVRSKLVTRIQKVCVVVEHRRAGVGKWMMLRVMEELRKGGADQVDLWVDLGREPARELYRACGFVERETVENYYGPGRNAVRMVAELAR